MITLIIGSKGQSENEVAKIIRNKSVFIVSSIWHHFKDVEEAIRLRGLLLIKNLDNEALFEAITGTIEKLKKEKIKTIAVTYRDDVIEAYKDDKKVTIIDLRGE